MSHRWIALLAFALVTMVAAPGTRASVSEPSWSIGDYWEYTTNGTAGFLIPWIGNGTARYVVVGQATISVGNVSYVCYHTKVWENLTTGGPVGPAIGDAWFRTSDLALVKLFVAFDFGGVQGNLTATYSPPVENRWPLATGTTWSATTNWTVAWKFQGAPPVTGTNFVTEAFSVQSSGSATVPAGVFATTPVRGEGVAGDHLVTDWSARAGNSVRVRSYSPSGAEQGSSQLTSYRYARGLAAVVSSDPSSGTAPLAVSFSAAVTGGQAPYAYSWSFGDGGTSMEPNPVHTFQGPGTYSVTLNVRDAAGTNVTQTISLAVAPPPFLSTPAGIATVVLPIALVIALVLALEARRRRRKGVLVPPGVAPVSPPSPPPPTR